MISVIEQADGSFDIIVPQEHAAEFKQMVARASNTWQDKSQAMIDFVDKISGLHGLLESTKNSKWDIPAEDAYAIAEVNTATEGVLLKTNDADSMEVVKLKQGDKLIILGIIPQESEYNR